jgi:hypothetical protein
MAGDGATARGGGARVVSEADKVADEEVKTPPAPVLPKEIGGAKGPEPTRYGDWEHKGRCTDF